MAVVVLLLAVITAARLTVDQPSLAIFIYALVPIVLASFWFELRGALTAAAAASLLFVGGELIGSSPAFAGSALWVATANRSGLYFGVAVLVVLLLRRERRMVTLLKEQRDELDELESLRAALTPPDVPFRPQLEVATSFTPAEGLVAGDFFLVSEGPMDSTTIVIGDVVGHGVDAARRAAYVRAALATFAKFSSDPVRLLQFAHAALVERVGDSPQFVTAVCVNIAAPPVMRLSWACAGHEAPWYLDTAAPLEGGRASVPLGLATGVGGIEAGSSLLAPGSGLIVFTDGLTEGRTAHRARSKPLELFGADRAREIIQTRWGEPPEQVIQALVGAVTEFAGGPLADDLCIVACRAAPAPRPAQLGATDVARRPAVRVPSGSSAEAPFVAK